MSPEKHSYIEEVVHDLHVKATFIDAELSGHSMADGGLGLLRSERMITRGSMDMFTEDTLAYDVVVDQAKGKSEASRDIFTAQDRGMVLADALLNGVEKLDLIDLLHASRAYAIEQSPLTRTLSAAGKESMRVLNSALYMELVQRLDIVQSVLDSSVVSLQELYDKAFAADNDIFRASMRENIFLLQKAVDDRARLALMVTRFNWHEDEQASELGKPLSPKDRDAINGTAAETVERLQLLKAYGVASMVVPGHKVGLPMDIALLPSLNIDMDAYVDEAIMDFAFLPPLEGREHVLPELVDSEDDSHQTYLRIGEEGSWMHLRLYNNGQFSYGHQLQNLPTDATERAFDAMHASSAFVRLRGLLIAIAYDAVASEDVVRNKTGGSVASQYVKLQEAAPHREPVLELLLRRQRQLMEAGVSPKNIIERHRNPRGWEEPKRTIGGYQRPLPEGYRRRPTAQEEARIYYAERKIPFSDLPEGVNFVSEYKRGTGPELQVFRRASFRGSSETKAYLGRLGLQPKRPKKS